MRSTSPSGTDAATEGAPPLIVWFRRDLRLADNPALAAAARSRRPLLPVFVFDAHADAAGAAARWWLHHSLAALSAALAARGCPLLLRTGDAPRELAALAAASGATTVVFNHAREPAAAAGEQRLRELAAGRLEVLGYPADALQEPQALRTAQGTAYRVFTAYWRALLRAGPPPAPRPAPRRLRACRAPVPGVSLEALGLRPLAPDWAAGWPRHWRPGEAGAQAAVRRLVRHRLAGYAQARDRLDAPGTSRLSPHLNFGEISPRQAWQAVHDAAAGEPRLARGAEAFLRQLAWREFAAQLLAQFPQLARAPLRPEFAPWPWRRDPHALRRWQRGATGYPVVDAGMRELRATGWMHNRARMITASFLVKHLLIDWRAGAEWFADTLVDADLASNATNWQWVAGCGTDAAPYFRIFNPVLQGRKFDPAGRYVRRWVPEIARLPDAFLHAPWTAPAAVLRAAGVRPGRDYPRPLVSHEQARARALAAFATIRRR